MPSPDGRTDAGAQPATASSHPSIHRSDRSLLSLASVPQCPLVSSAERAARSIPIHSFIHPFNHLFPPSLPPGRISYSELFDKSAGENEKSFSELSATLAEKHRALEYILRCFVAGIKLRDLLYFQQRLDFRRLRGYEIFNSKIYNTVYTLVIVVNLSVAFYEAPPSRLLYWPP